MTEKEKKSKSGAGKFLLGAVLGAAAGAAAAKFVHVKVSKGEKELEDSIADASDSLTEDEEDVLAEEVNKVKKSSEKKDSEKKEEKSEKSEKKDSEED